MADRFYCPGPVLDGHVALAGNEARHLARVCRMGVGGLIEVFDGLGSAYRAKVIAIKRDRVELVVMDDPLPDRSAPVQLTLATAVPKGERFDWLVEKATELGVVRLVPLVTERSVVDPRGTKLDRLRRLIIEASKQCGRNRLLELADPTAWLEYLRAESAPVRFLAHLGSGALAASWPRVGAGERAALAIGPEGGFTQDEVDEAVAAGWTAIGMGPTILRIETAALAGAAALLLCAAEASE